MENWTAGRQKKKMRHTICFWIYSNILENVPLKEAYAGNGILINSNFLNNMTVEEAKKEIINRFEIKGIGKKDIKYRLRDWCASRQRYWGCPIPIIYREDGAVLPVDQSELPIKLPDDIEGNC